MTKRSRKSPWVKAFERSFVAMTRRVAKSGVRASAGRLGPARVRRAPPPGAGAWVAGVAMGAGGARRFRLFRPPGVGLGERLPLMVMLHGCGQDAVSFAASTRMNRVALRERFLVLYPEQDRLSNGQGCWNWFDTRNGRAWGEAALIMKAIDQVCLLQPVDRARVAIAGLSAGASMAALLATRHPGRFKALVMHSGMPPGAAHSALSALGAMRRSGPALAAAPASTVAPAARQAPGAGAGLPPLLVIHGDADAIVSPHNAQMAARFWADAAGAQAGTARRMQRGRRYPMSVTDFKRRGRTAATLVAVDGLAHAWSGGAAGQPFSDARGPDASRMAWTFAARQFRA